MARLKMQHLSAAAAVFGALLVSSSAMADDRVVLVGRINALDRQIADAQLRLRPLQTAQGYDQPPAEVPNAEAQEGPPAGPPDAAGLDVRVDRLENQLRTLNGQIEQAQFQIHRLEEQLKKFQQDVDFRFQDQAGRPGGRPRHAEAAEPTPRTAVSPPEAAPESAPPSHAARGDAFDPSAQPDAPGAPRPLAGSAPIGTPLPSGPVAVEDDPNAPLDLSRTATGSIPVRRPGAGPGLPDDGATAALPGPAALTPGGAIIAPAPGGAREDFNAALALLRQGQYESAETDFQAFIHKHPKDRLVADAVYYLGETYSLRGRQREAAEQFLKVSTDYARSARAPDGMVKLGVSLNALGAKEQACATFAEVSRKYPNASIAIKNSVDRESKRAKC
jgi:tol-pal system protein YbgF